MINMNNKFGFEKLEVWKKAREIKKEIGILVLTFPHEEKFPALWLYQKLTFY
jgi:hypothetical protein